MSPLCVVVVTFNGARWIRRCLHSLVSDDLRPHVIVIDNASTDETKTIVETEFSGVELVRGKTNEGFGRGNNLGIRRALDHGSSFICLLNQDAYVLPGTLRELTKFLSERPEFGVVSPLHCSPDAAHLDRKTMRGYLQTRLPDYLADACMGQVRPHYSTFGINAAIWLVRRETFLRIGGFDPLFFMYGEDDDLLYRMEFHGVAFGFLPSSRAVHLRESSAPARRTRWHDMLRGAMRRRSELLTLIKRPNFSVSHMAVVLVAEGWISPLADAMIRGRIGELFINWLAALQTMLEFPRIVRHARLSASVGPHFI